MGPSGGVSKWGGGEHCGLWMEGISGGIWGRPRAVGSGGGSRGGVSPICPGSGECGRGRVGDVLVRMRLFRLLVRQLGGNTGGGEGGGMRVGHEPPYVENGPPPPKKNNPKTGGGSAKGDEGEEGGRKAEGWGG